MKKMLSVFSALVLVCSFVFLGLSGAEVSAAELSGNETAYAVTDVNVRTGPGTDYSIIGVLTQGASVECTGIDSNGWSQVIFDGYEGYIRSRYLSNTQSEQAAHDQDHAHASSEDTSAGFEKTNCYLYAIADVNVRTGPGMQYDTLDQCPYGERVHCTGIGANGWTRVKYRGQTAYIRSSYLSESRPGPKSTGLSGLNAYGRLTIPSVGVDVALYYCSSDAQYASLQQSIVDAEDSAAYLDQISVDGVIIADHKHQGFDAIRSCVPKVTRAYIDFGSNTREYICTAVGQGRNTGSDLRDWDNNSLNYGSIPGGLAMYTCNENWNDITITYWKPAR